MMRTTPLERLVSRFALVLLALLVLGPLAWAISASFKTEATVIAYPPSFVPSPPTLASYGAILRQANFLTELFNSILYAFGAVALTIAVSAPAGFAASRLEFRGKRAIMLLILATSMIPGVALLVPT